MRALKLRTGVMVLASLVHVIAAIYAPLMRGLALPNAHTSSDRRGLLSCTHHIKLIIRIVIDTQSRIKFIAGKLVVCLAFFLSRSGIIRKRVASLWNLHRRLILHLLNMIDIIRMLTLCSLLDFHLCLLVLADDSIRYGLPCFVVSSQFDHELLSFDAENFSVGRDAFDCGCAVSIVEHVFLADHLPGAYLRQSNGLSSLQFLSDFLRLAELAPLLLDLLK